MEPTPSAHGRAMWSRWRALSVLIDATVAVVLMSELFEGAIQQVVQRTGISEFFLLGVTLVPLVGNVAGHFIAVQAAGKDQMDLILGIAYGSSLQIALVVVPLLVFASLFTREPMSLIFHVHELRSAGRSCARLLLDCNGWMLTLA